MSVATISGKRVAIFHFLPKLYLARLSIGRDEMVAQQRERLLVPKFAVEGSKKNVGKVFWSSGPSFRSTATASCVAVRVRGAAQQ